MKKVIAFAALIMACLGLRAQTELIIPTGHQGFLGVDGLSVSPDGVLAATFVENEVKIWDVKKHQLLKTLHTKNENYGAALFSPDSRTLMLSCGYEASVKNPQALNIVAFDTKTFRESNRWDIKILDRARALAFSPDGKLLYLGGKGPKSSLVRLNVNTGNAAIIYKSDDDVTRMTLSPDGARILVESGIDYKRYAILNAADGAIIKDFAHDENHYRFTPKGDVLSVDFLETRPAGKVAMRFRFRWLDAATYSVQATQTLKYVGNLVTNTPDYDLDFFPGSDDILFNAEKYYHVVSRAGAIKAIPYTTKVEENYKLHVKTISPTQAVVIRENYISTMNPETGERSQMGMGVITPDHLYNAPDGKALAVMGQFGAKPYFITWPNGKLFIKQVPAAFSLIGASLNTSADGKMVSWAELVTVKVADVYDVSKPVSVFPIKNGEYTVISADKNLIAVAAGHENYSTTDKIYIANRKTGLVKPLGKGYFSCGTFSDDNHYFLGINQRLNDSPIIALYDLQKGIKVWEVEDQKRNTLIMPFFYNATQVGYYDNSDDEFDYLQLSNGTALRTEAAGANALAGNANLQRTILPAALNKPDVQSGPNYNAVVDSGRFSITGFKDNTLKVYNRAGVKLMDIILTRDGSDWAVITPGGRFDASENMMKQLYYANGRQVISLEKLFEKYYTPNLGGRLLAGEVLPPVPPVSNINPSPRVKISYAEITRNLDVVDDKTPVYQNTTGAASITVNASAENDKIDEIRLFQNGKIVNLATRGLFVTNNATGTETKTYTITLLPGQNNFRALALNSQRTESEPSNIIVNYRATGVQPGAPVVDNNLNGVIASVDKNATLHLVVVGINQYKNPKMSLNYALADATAFKDEAEKGAKTMTPNVKTYFITDDKADKDGILQAFKTVQQNAQPQDVFVFYYAGHGVISEKNKEFYLVPNDVTDLKNVDEALAQHGIPSKLLQQYAIDITAQKQVFILDACQSAGAFAKLMANDGDQQKNLAVVARSTGTHWIAASGSQQFANEFSQLGHGAFTYILLKAMKGEAVSNKMVTINGLKSFLQVQVPDLMKKYNGTPQYPASYGFGSDFPVEVMK